MIALQRAGSHYLERDLRGGGRGKQQRIRASPNPFERRRPPRAGEEKNGARTIGISSGRESIVGEGLWIGIEGR